MNGIMMNIEKGTMRKRSADVLKNCKKKKRSQDEDINQKEADHFNVCFNTFP